MAEQLPVGRNGGRASASKKVVDLSALANLVYDGDITDLNCVVAEATTTCDLNDLVCDG